MKGIDSADEPFMIAAIKVLNYMRNELAHKLPGDDEKLRKHITSFITIVGDHSRLKGKLPENNRPEQFFTCVGGLLGWLTSGAEQAYRAAKHGKPA